MRIILIFVLCLVIPGAFSQELNVFTGVETGEKVSWLTNEDSQKYLKPIDSGFMLLEINNGNTRVTIYNKELAIEKVIDGTIKNFNAKTTVIDLVKLGDHYMLMAYGKRVFYYAILDQNTWTFLDPVVIEESDNVSKIKFALDKKQQTIAFYNYEFNHNKGEQLVCTVYDSEFNKINSFKVNDELLNAELPKKIESEKLWSSKVCDVDFINENQVVMAISVVSGFDNSQVVNQNKKVVLIKLTINEGTFFVKELSNNFTNTGAPKLEILNNGSVWINFLHSLPGTANVGMANLIVDGESLTITKTYGMNFLNEVISHEKFASIRKFRTVALRKQSYDLNAPSGLVVDELVEKDSGEKFVVIKGLLLDPVTSKILVKLGAFRPKLYFFDNLNNFNYKNTKEVLVENSQNKFQFIFNYKPIDRRKKEHKKTIGWEPLGLKEKSELRITTINEFGGATRELLYKYDSKGWFVMFPSTALYQNNQLVVIGGDKRGKQLLRVKL